MRIKGVFGGHSSQGKGRENYDPELCPKLQVEAILSTALLCPLMPHTNPRPQALGPDTRCPHKHKFELEGLFLSHLHRSLPAAVSAASPRPSYTGLTQESRPLQPREHSWHLALLWGLEEKRQTLVFVKAT